MARYIDNGSPIGFAIGDLISPNVGLAEVIGYMKDERTNSKFNVSFETTHILKTYILPNGRKVSKVIVHPGYSYTMQEITTLLLLFWKTISQMVSQYLSKCTQEIDCLAHLYVLLDMVYRMVQTKQQFQIP